MAASSQNTGRQLPVATSRPPPSTGATIGATLDTVMNRENRRAAATPSATSAAIARASTIPPPPDAPCTNRHTDSIAADGASAHSAEAIAQTSVEPMSRPRRPRASDSGPSTSCPTTRADDVGGERELHGGLARAEIGRQLGERREVEVHRQWTESGEPAQEQGEQGESAVGELWHASSVGG